MLLRVVSSTRRSPWPLDPLSGRSKVFHSTASVGPCRAPMRNSFFHFALLLPFILVPVRGAAVEAGVRIGLDEATRLALAHNHALRASRAAVSQRKADEITADLRPNPQLNADAQFVPLFTPEMATRDYLNDTLQFDAGLSYLFERGGKRQHRLKAAVDQTKLARLQARDRARVLRFEVASTFIDVLRAESALRLARSNLADYGEILGIGEHRFRDGAISRRDLLKLRVQRLQFQSDLESASLARRQALAELRQLLGFDSVPSAYDVQGKLIYRPFSSQLQELLAKAQKERPDLLAAEEGVKAARSQYELERARAKQDVTGTVSYSHVGGYSSASLFVSVPLPIFDRNQGAIDAAGYAITQAKEAEQEARERVRTDVQSAYDAVLSERKMLDTFRSGYLREARTSRNISRYAYRRGAARTLDFLDAERSLRDTELAYRNELASYLQALAQLEEAVGARNLP